jgi:hypothetical protein
MSDITELKRRMSTPAHPDGDPTLMVVEILRITKERDALLEDKARLDWLDNAPDDPTNNEEADWTRTAMNIVERTSRGNLRAAIDAAKGVAK